MPKEEKENNYLGNTNALKYKDEEELQKRIEEYFENCDKREKPYTMSGLAYYLGIHRNTLVNYGKNDLYCELIKKAKERVQMQLEENGLDGTANPTFTIFNLKANYKWDDGNKVEINVNKPKVEKVEEVVDNSNLEKVMYEENKHNKDDDRK